jgi:hypothetical protein
VVDHQEIGPVPELLRGAWKRSWIRYEDGVVDDTTTVVWVQLDVRMADLRVPAAVDDLADRGSLAGCRLDDLRRLAAGESSTGSTVCSPIEVGGDGVRRATASWVDDDLDVAFQPVTAFPEPGLLEWNDDGTVMIETAPSGAYVERWERLPGSSEPLVLRRMGATLLYIAGAISILVRDRPVPVPVAERLDTLVAEAGDDRAAVEALVDCEFSFAVRRGSTDDAVVTASTHPWRVGEVVDVGVR